MCKFRNNWDNSCGIMDIDSDHFDVSENPDGCGVDGECTDPGGEFCTNYEDE